MTEKKATFYPDVFSIYTELYEVNYVRKKLGKFRTHKIFSSKTDHIYA